MLQFPPFINIHSFFSLSLWIMQFQKHTNSDVLMQCLDNFIYDRINSNVIADLIIIQDLM